MPKKSRELKSILSKAGFINLPRRGKGNHSMWKHPLLPNSINLAGKDGDDAERYQEADVRNALRQLEQLQEPEDDTSI